MHQHELTQHGNTSTDLGHVNHCYDYIRQSMLCSGDTTLEGRGHKAWSTEGWGATHICRDFEQLSLWQEDVYVGEDEDPTHAAHA